MCVLLHEITRTCTVDSSRLALPLTGLGESDSKISGLVTPLLKTLNFTQVTLTGNSNNNIKNLFSMSMLL